MNSDADILRRFFDALNAEERMWSDRLSKDSIGIYLRSAITELDWFYYNILTNEETTETEEQFYILRLGVTRLIKTALTSRSSYIAPALTMRRTHESAVSTLTLASALGVVDHGRRVAQSVEAGLCTIHERASNYFVVTLPFVVPDEDYYERAVVDHYTAQYRARLEALWRNVYSPKQDIEKDVDKLLTDLVFVFAGDFIGYDSDPLLDGYFYSRAYYEMQLYEGHDTYNYAARFGGIPFETYYLALVFILSLTLKHIAFANALIAKHPWIKLENVLTISGESETLIESIRDAVNYFGQVSSHFQPIDSTAAAQLFRVLSVGRDNVGLLDRPGCPVPMLIRNTESGVIRCNTGALTNPVLFLLESLRYHFPKDYDRNQQARERSFQRAIRRVVGEVFPGITFEENIKIRVDGRLRTDIDLVIVDQKSGVVFLCQLKFQELFGADLHSKQVRTSRLKHQTASWLESVDLWLQTAGEDRIRSSLRIPRHVPPLSIRRLVIAKHYAFPARDISSDVHFGYATWMQCVNAINQVEESTPASDRTLQSLFSAIKANEAPGGVVEHLVEPSIAWKLTNVTFEVRQQGA